MIKQRADSKRKVKYPIGNQLLKKEKYAKPNLEISKEIVEPTTNFYSPQFRLEKITFEDKKVKEDNINSFQPKINTQSKLLVKRN